METTLEEDTQSMTEHGGKSILQEGNAHLDMTYCLTSEHPSSNPPLKYSVIISPLTIPIGSKRKRKPGNMSPSSHAVAWHIACSLDRQLPP
jgi:hypothetical protein